MAVKAMLRGVNKMLGVHWVTHQPSQAFDNVLTPVFDRALVIVIPLHILQSVYNRNNSSFRLKHPGVPDYSDASGGMSYPLTENQTLPVAHAMGCVALLPGGGYYTMPLILVTCRIV
jgi:hypothetical protein